VLVAAALLACALGAADPARAQSGDDIDTLNRKVVELLGTGKFADAMSLAQRSIE
jgi:hypothetical protein